MTALKGAKPIFASKGVIGAILMVLLPILAYFGYDVNKEDVQSLIGLVPAILGGLVLGWKRIKMTVNQFSLTSWVIAGISAIGAVYTVLTGDTQAPKELGEQLLAAFTAISSILAAFGIHVADKEIKV